MSPTRLSSPQPVILVVDDDAAVLSSTKFALEIEGYRVQAFTSAEELLGMETQPPHACLVVDQKLPGKSGLELIEALRARAGRLPTILMTTNPPAALRRAAGAAGVTIVEKPLLGNVLSEAIERMLG